MPTSYVDEIVVRYLKKEHYLITQGIWFPLPKGKKQVGGWSDIDIFAVKPGEGPLIIQCKSFIGTEKSIEVVRKLDNWFDEALVFLKNSDFYAEWLTKDPRKILVVDSSIKKTADSLKKLGIDVWDYHCVLDELIRILKSESDEKSSNIMGKEEDVLLRILFDLVREDLLKQYKNPEECGCSFCSS
jgi:hypothetical protein